MRKNILIITAVLICLFLILQVTSTLWQINTYIYEGNASITYTEAGLFLSPTGSNAYTIASGKLYQYSLSTPWNISSASYVRNKSLADSSAWGLYFKDDGTKVYYYGGFGGAVYQGSLSTPWDISTLSNEKTYSVGSASSFTFSSDGTKMYTIELFPATIYQYNLTSAWDISTASYYTSKNLSPSSQAKSAFFSSNGSKLYVYNTNWPSYSSSIVYQYSLSTPWDVNTLSSDGVSKDLTSYGTAVGAIYLNPAGNKFYFGSGGIVSQFYTNIVPNITLNSPINYYNSSSTTINFSCTPSDERGITNVTLKLDGISNETNSSGINNVTYIFTKILSDGSHNWSCLTFDTDNQSSIATYNNFTIDSISPVITFISPINNIFYDNSTKLVNLTVSDTHIDTILYNWNGTNYTYTTPINVSFSEGSNTLYVYANDSFGNTNSSSITFYIDTTNPSIDYSTSTTLTGNYSQNFIYANITSSDLNLKNTTIYLYNSTGLVSNYNFNRYSCYQETATSSNLCGGLNSGNYYLDGTYTNPLYSYDGDWNTFTYLPYSTSSSYTNYIYINYTKPINSSQNSMWQVKGHTNTSDLISYNFGSFSGFQNLSIPSDCWNQNVLQFRTFSYRGSTSSKTFSFSSGISFQCYNGTDWNSLATEECIVSNSTSLYACNELYEESVIWDIQPSNSYYNFTSLSDKIYYLNATSFDTSGNSNSTSTQTILLDTTSPISTATATSGGSSYTFDTWTKNNITTTITAIDLGVGFSSVIYPKYCVDTLNTCTPTTFISTGVTTTAEGTSYIRYYSNDSLGNSETIKSSILKIDYTSPTITKITPINATYNTKTIVFNISSTDTLSGAGSCWYSLTNGATNYSMTNSGSYWYSTNTSMTEGSHTVKYYCNDTAGNLNNTETTTFFIDTVYPQISIVSPTNNSYSSDTGLDVLYTHSDINTDSCWYSNDTYLVNTTLSGCANITTVTWSNGQHNVTVWTNDTSGNLNLSSISFTIDSVNPAADLLSPTNNSYYNTSQNYTVNLTDNVGMKNATLYIYNSSDMLVNETSILFGTGVIQQVVGFVVNLADGIYKWFYSIFDFADNSYSTINNTITIDTINPYLSIVYPSNTTYATNVSQLNYTYTGLNVDKCWYSLNGGVTNSTPTSCNNFTGLTSTEGSNTWTVYMNDSAGNSNSSTVTFFKDTIYPLISYNPTTPNNATYRQVSDVLVNITVSDTNKQTINLNFDGVNSTFINNDGDNYWTNKTGLTEGAHTYYAWITDVAGNFNKTSIRTIYIDLTNPVANIVSPTPSSYNYNTSIALNYTRSDLYLDSCWYNLDGVLNITLSSCANTTFNTSLGNHILNLFINDSSGRLTTKSVSFNIDLDAPAVSLDFPMDDTWLNYKNNIYFNITASDSTLSACSLYGNWTGSWALNSTNFSPNNGSTTSFVKNISSDGIYSWNVICNDTAGNTAWGSPLANYTLNIDSIYPTISYTSNTPANNTNTTNDFIYVEVSANDTNEYSITFDLYNSVGIYNSTTYTTAIRDINWTSLPDDNYYYNVTIVDMATNTNSTLTRKITLDDTAPTLTMVLPEAQNYGDNNTIYLNYTVSDNVIGLDACWYYVYNSTGDLIIPTTILSSCENTTFSLPGGDIDYTINLLAQDLLSNVVAVVRTFGIRTESPAISLYPANDTFRNYVDNHYFNFTVSSNADNITSCELWGDFNGTWSLNQTKLLPTIGVMTPFDLISLENGTYLWNVKCTDNFGKTAWGQNNQTFGIDLTNPNLTIAPVGTSTGSQAVTLTTYASDTNLDYCRFIIFNLAGSVDGLNNKTYSCNTTQSASVSAFASYNMSVWAFDKAGNTNFTSEIFTVSQASSGGGSGGSYTPVVTISNSTSWTMKTPYGSEEYQLNMIKGMSLTKAIEIKNTGVSDRVIGITCKGDFCNNIEFSQLALIVSPNEIKTIDFTIEIPEDTEDGIYTTQIIATDDNMQGKYISITTVVSSSPTNVVLSKLSSNKWGIPYWAISIMIFVLLSLFLEVIFIKFKFRWLITIILSSIATVIIILLI